MLQTYLNSITTRAIITSNVFLSNYIINFTIICALDVFIPTVAYCYTYAGTPLPTPLCGDIRVVAWHWSGWEYLHHRN